MRHEQVSERVIGRGCAGCPKSVTYSGRGRPPRYCSPACRQRAWALRQAEQALGTPADPRPAVVREVVERVVVREVEPRVAAAAASTGTPSRSRDWENALEVLAAQLDDADHPLAREHWRHGRLLVALDRVRRALDAAHPGGLGRLDR